MPTPERRIPLYILTPWGWVQLLGQTGATSITELKEVIEEIWDVAVHRQRLTWHGFLLQDASRLCEIGVASGDSITLQLLPTRRLRSKTALAR